MVDAIIVTAISAIIAFLSLVINLYFNFWRGPVIRCGKIRYILISNSIDGTLLHIPLTFTNIGSNTGIIEMVLITLERLQDNIDKLAYVPYIDNFQVDMIRIKGILPSAVESPFHQFAIAPKSSILKNILFVNQKSFRFIKGEYKLKILFQLNGEKEFKEYASIIIKIIKDMGRDQLIISIDPFGAAKILEVPNTTVNFNEWWRIFS